jgi:hypothetical protein
VGCGLSAKGLRTGRRARDRFFLGEGRSAISAAQGVQYGNATPSGRNQSPPQRSQYLSSSWITSEFLSIVPPLFAKSSGSAPKTNEPCADGFGHRARFSYDGLLDVYLIGCCGQDLSRAAITLRAAAGNILPRSRISVRGRFAPRH